MAKSDPRKDVAKSSASGKELDQHAQRQSAALLARAPLNTGTSQNNMAKRLGRAGRKIASDTAEGVTKLARGTADLTKEVAKYAFDLNGDGKVDEEDLKLAVQEGKRFSKSVAEEVGKLARDAAQSELAKEAAAGALVGAAIAVPVPGIGPVAGATIGASISAYRNITRNK